MFYDWIYGTDEYWPLIEFPKRMHKIGKRFMKTYGTPMMGANFRPYVTITSFVGAAHRLKIIRAKTFKFKPEYLYVCGLGPSYTCQRFVKMVNFYF